MTTKLLYYIKYQDPCLIFLSYFNTKSFNTQWDKITVITLFIFSYTFKHSSKSTNKNLTENYNCFNQEIS